MTILHFTRLQIRVGAIETFVQKELEKEHKTKESVIEVLILYPSVLSVLISPHTINDMSETSMLYNINYALNLMKLKQFKSYKDWDDRIQEEMDLYLDEHDIHCHIMNEQESFVKYK